jgi:hypothetical protein
MNKKKELLESVVRTFWGACAVSAMLVACGGDDSPPAWEGTSCGGILGAGCPADVAYCDYPETHDCGILDGSGVCRARPESCTKDCPGTCGCDGKFYCNACEAHRAGVDDEPSVTCMR